MKQNIEIEVPEGYKAIYNESTQKIDIVKIDNKPKTWKEFCDKYPVTPNEYWIEGSTIERAGCHIRSIFNDKHYCTSSEEAEAFLSLMQLRQLRKVWVGDWKPDILSDFWVIDNSILYSTSGIHITCRHNTTHPLSFPTNEMAKEFLECFKDLIEKAKVLL